MKKEITVEVIGKPAESVVRDFYNMFFRVIDEKYGREFLLKLNEELNK